MKKLLLTVLIIFSGLCLKAQATQDSLYTLWQDETQSKYTRAKAYDKYIWDGFLFSNPDTAFILVQELLHFGEEHSYPEAKATAYNTMGISNWVKSDFPKALDYCLRSLKIYEEIGNKKGSAGPINNIGAIYKRLGNYTKALDYFQRSLKIEQEVGTPKGMAVSLNNIGRIYDDQEDYSQALNYYQRSFKINQEIGDRKGIAVSLNNTGRIYMLREEYPKALDNNERSLKIAEELNDQRLVSNILVDIGLIYQSQGDSLKALDYYHRGLDIYAETGDKKGSAEALKNIGLVYQKHGDHPKAVEYCKKALIINQEIGGLGYERDACQCLYETYKAMGKASEALVYLEKLRVIDDSLNSAETIKQLERMEFAKVMLQDSIEKAEEARKVEEDHQEEVRQGEKTRNFALAGGLVLLILAGGLYFRVRYIRKSKAALQVEKDRSENLLLNILPADIAAELKEKGRADARDFDMVSILFTDFKGFTAVSEKMSAKELVSEINICFEAFDGIMEEYKIEKIKTIGDAYMAAGGLPVLTDDSIKNTVLAALEMQAFIRQRKSDRDAAGKPAFEMRIGIHSGPVVAGIVGVKKFQYDIWGDTVNTASRMESLGAVGQVNISQATYEFLKDDLQFSFESRGKIKAKGKGEIEMYFVSKN